MIADLASSERCKTGVIGTLGWGETAHLSPLANTTPSAVELQSLFNQMRDYGLVAMEVSSHGLVQGRVEQCEFDVAVFTNLSRDHLDYHGTMQAYGEAKLTLLSEFATTANIVNYDDRVVQNWLKEKKIPNPVCFGEELPSDLDYPYISFDKARYISSGLSCKLRTSWGNADITLPLFGKFNLYNLTAALGVLLNLAYDFDWLVDKIAQLNAVVGRMQAFSADNHPTCIVDYAHTPDALKQALEALSLHVGTNITCVFGCGGDRDKGKRAQMATVAEQYANLIIVTNDNPRTEAEQLIVDDIIQGFTHPGSVLVEYDRAKAIKLAIEQTTCDGIILIAGKGHEDYQIIGAEKVFFSDSLVAQQILKGEKR
jgi:UDP-N-acetylmuramoyl-L-alanyl-D-glutamate--2,6-diaminopimelate ligase